MHHLDNRDLGAWYHHRSAPRRFLIDAINGCRTLDEQARTVPNTESLETGDSSSSEVSPVIRWLRAPPRSFFGTIAKFLGRSFELAQLTFESLLRVGVGRRRGGKELQQRASQDRRKGRIPANSGLSWLPGSGARVCDPHLLRTALVLFDSWKWAPEHSHHQGSPSAACSGADPKREHLGRHRSPLSAAATQPPCPGA